MKRYVLGSEYLTSEESWDNLDVATKKEIKDDLTELESKLYDALNFAYSIARKLPEVGYEGKNYERGVMVAITQNLASSMNAASFLRDYGYKGKITLEDVQRYE